MRKRLFNILGATMVLGFLASPAAAQGTPPAMTHDLQGKDNCMMCHAVGVMEAIPDVPADHEGRAVDTCLMCHAPDSPMQTAGAAPQFTHDLQGKDNCLMCHAAGVMEPIPDVPASHEGRGVETCLWCHTQAEGG